MKRVEGSLSVQLSDAPGAEMSDQGERAGGDRIAVLKTYKLYVDGKFPRTESGRFFRFESADQKWAANLCLSSRKDFRDAVTAARAAFEKWSKLTPMLRAQILYRIAEMLEARRAQFVQELIYQGTAPEAAELEVGAAVDALVHYAGWADKYQQVLSSVNPVAGPYFNFSITEPMGVVAVLAPEQSSLYGLVEAIVPLITGGNSVIALASRSKPLCAITLGEVLNSSDVPPGVVNLLTGERKELLPHFASHMDVNGMFVWGGSKADAELAQNQGAANLKRVVLRSELEETDFVSKRAVISNGARLENIKAFQEVKTLWHPIGV